MQPRDSHLEHCDRGPIWEELDEDDALLRTPRGTPAPLPTARQPRPSLQRDSTLSTNRYSHVSSIRHSVATFLSYDSTDWAVLARASPPPLDSSDPNEPEEDDWLHDPHLFAKHKKWTRRSRWFSTRAIVDFGVLLLLFAGIVFIFLGYPVLTALFLSPTSKLGGFGLGGTNGSGQVPEGPLNRDGLIDRDTPKSAYWRRGIDDPSKRYRLVYSDEFETDGRSFWPGDDPFWEALDLHYWADAITTREGALQITLSEHVSHNLNFRGGMLQSWNKFCFTGGYVAASVRLPGTASRGGTWPAVWAMGNLGRAGYGATLEGTWPYAYEGCDVGTLPNQTTWDGKPTAALTGGSVTFNKKHKSNALSFLPGQRLSACTCPNDDHPGPRLKDGSWRGRSAPEIDVFEAQVSSSRLQVSQSGQFAPFNMYYEPTNTTAPAWRFWQQGARVNSYTGEVNQQSMSGVTPAVQEAVQRGGDGSFAEYGFEYRPGSDGYITWTSGGKPSWSLLPQALAPDTVANISARSVSQEPMYLILNLGLSDSFGKIDWDGMEFPYVMSVDWVRVYQEEGKENVGCDPKDWPTKGYIQRHYAAYTNPNLTIWGSTSSKGGYGADWPRNRLQPGGCSAPVSKLPGSPTHPIGKAPIRSTDVAANWEKPA